MPTENCKDQGIFNEETARVGKYWNRLPACIDMSPSPLVPFFKGQLDYQWKILFFLTFSLVFWFLYVFPPNCSFVLIVIPTYLWFFSQNDFLSLYVNIKLLLVPMTYLIINKFYWLKGDSHMDRKALVTTNIDRLNWTLLRRKKVLVHKFLGRLLIRIFSLAIIKLSIFSKAGWNEAKFRQGDFKCTNPNDLRMCFFWNLNG